jgi:hypothetical protein
MLAGPETLVVEVFHGGLGWVGISYYSSIFGASLGVPASRQGCPQLRLTVLFKGLNFNYAYHTTKIIGAGGKEKLG